MKQAKISAFCLLATTAHGSSDSCDAGALAAAAESFRRTGYAVMPGFAGADEVAAMLASMDAMVDDWWQAEKSAPSDGTVFTTGANQTSAQAKSKYFFDSAARVHFFREADDGGSADDAARPPLNKVGHGLHLEASTPFGAYARSARVAAVAREVAGLVAPVLPQSMYIFKEARVGAAVTSHQDGTFLYTRPQQTVVGLWLALHDAHTGNGCLWARPESHAEPLRRRFVRTAAEDGEVAMHFVNASADSPEAFFSTALGGAAAGSEAATRGEAARSWEGTWPPPGVAAGEPEAAAELAARGFVPVSVKAGDLVMFAGTLDHLSLPNTSPDARHTFQCARARHDRSPRRRPLERRSASRASEVHSLPARSFSWRAAGCTSSRGPMRALSGRPRTGCRSRARSSACDCRVAQNLNLTHPHSQSARSPGRHCVRAIERRTALLWWFLSYPCRLVAGSVIGGLAVSQRPALSSVEQVEHPTALGQHAAMDTRARRAAPRT